ncbi:MAG: zinc-binding dehydrogenase [Candidatus Latescibacterota bacterium]|nr:zinc-binding dehydrogenase [Candidatus Latescibacterota bacterium]
MSLTSQAAVMVGEKFEIREYPVLDPDPDAVLIRTELAGICGTDLHNWDYQRLEGDVLLGHENVGIIDKMGANVKKDLFGEDLAEGDRIVFFPRTPVGIYGFLNPSESPHLRGGFADYINLQQAEASIFKVDMSAETAVLTEPFNIGVHGVMRSGIQFGDTVAVQGSGAIGLVTLICAKASGAGKLIIVGGPPGRLELARKIGADVVIDIAEIPAPEERIQAVRDATPRGEGADVVFECAGFLPAITEGLEYVKQSGTYVEMGHFVDIGSMDFNPNQQLMRKNIRIEAIWGGRVEYFMRGIPVMERGDFPIEEMVSHVLPLDRISEGFNALAGGYNLDGKDAIKIAMKGGAA